MYPVEALRRAEPSTIFDIGCSVLLNMKTDVNDGVMSSLLVDEVESEKAVSNAIDVGFSMRDSQGGVATTDVLVVVTVLVGREEKRKSELGFGS